ncbi:MAG: dynamin family protein [Cyanobacteria bacterium P01_F01_bin.150]
MSESARKATNDNVDSKSVKISKSFKKFFENYHRVESYLNLDNAKRKYIEQNEAWINRLEQEEFPVAFFGSFSAGKSTIINAILGREVLPEATQSTTAFPTILRKGNADFASVYYIDEDAKKLLWTQLCL